MSSIEKLAQPALECLDTADPCAICPFQVAAEACKVLAASRKNEQLEQENTRLRADLSKTQQRAEAYARDGLTNFLLPRAVAEEMNNNSELQKTLRTGNWGMIWVDVRGLKWVNDTVSQASGDGLICTASSRLYGATYEAAQDRLTRNTRSRPQKVANDRRAKTPDQDLYIRSSNGGDEFAVLMLDVSAEELTVVEERLRKVFSTREAIEHDAKMQIPTIASVASCHASDPALGLSPAVDDLFTMYRSVSDLANNNHKESKQAQYDEMRTMVLAQKPNTPSSSDDRAIAGLFFSLYCPNFATGKISLV